MSLHRLPVRALMAQSVVTIYQDQLVADASQAMQEFNFRRLPVMDEDDCMVGMVSAADILEAETASRVFNSYEPGTRANWLTVADIMTRDVITIDPDATVGELAARLVEHKIDGVPVVEPDPRFPRRARLVGIITAVDIFGALAEAWRAEQVQPHS
ncbi:MAG: CBS domain-containing protein [Litorilinea sp.]